MKYLLQPLFIFSVFIAFGQDPDSTITESKSVPDEVYIEMAKEMCACFNDATVELSDEVRTLIEESGRNGDDVGMVLEQFAEENPEQALKDSEILLSLEDGEVMDCIAVLEEKYDKYETDETEEEIQSRLIEIMSKIDSCALTYAFILAGL